MSENLYPRLGSLLGKLSVSLESFSKRTDQGLLPTCVDLQDAESTVQYLRELGWTADAQRIEHDRQAFVEAVTNLWFAQGVEELSLEESTERAYLFGWHLQRVDMQTLRDFAVGRAATWAAWLRGLADQLGEHGSPSAEEPQYLFRYEGAVYRVRFLGEAGTINATLRGAKYINELLRHPNRRFGSSELQALNVDHDEAQTRRELGSRSALENLEEGETPPQWVARETEPGEVRESLKKCRERLAEIRDELDQARADGDDAVSDRLVTEHEDICAEVRRLPGRKRFRNPNEKARTSVRARIECVIANCKTEWGLPRFADHLKAIDYGFSCVYAPDPIPDWHF